MIDQNTVARNLLNDAQELRKRTRALYVPRTSVVRYFERIKLFQDEIQLRDGILIDLRVEYDLVQGYELLLVISEANPDGPPKISCLPFDDILSFHNASRSLNSERNWQRILNEVVLEDDPMLFSCPIIEAMLFCDLDAKHFPAKLFADYPGGTFGGDQLEVVLEFGGFQTIIPFSQEDSWRLFEKKPRQSPKKRRKGK